VYYYDGKEDLLDNELVESLIAISDDIKKLLGDLLDIEFAVKDRQIYILQARPITTLKTDDPLILDNSNIVESYPGISLPLTVSFVDLVYSGVFRGVCRRVLKNDKELDKHSDVFLNMTGHANGRVYYKISNWYTVLKFLPMNKKIIPVWQEMLGVRNKNYDHDDVVIPWHVRVGTYFNSVYELMRVPKNMAKLNALFITINDDFYSRFSPDLSPAELKALFDEVKVKLFDVWDVTLLNDMYAFIFTGLLKSRYKKKGLSEKEINQVISGISDIESMKPIKALVKLAYEKDQMSQDDYERSKQEYICRYGDRNLEELKLESRTFRSDPDLLEERIQSYRKDPGRLKETYESLSADAPKKAGRGSIAKRCALGISNREISRLNRSRIYGIVRLIFDALGDCYAKQDLMTAAEDIYYLTVDEVFAMIDHPRDMRPVIDERKQQFEIFRHLPAYSRLVFAEKEYDKNHVSVNAYVRHNQENELTGTPCSGGIAEGEALVITDINDTYDVAGKILVTKMTDPGWVFLLANAQGVISEKGSLLSHTAIISRELKIPSVVGVPDLMTTVHTGDILRMDGDSGKIEIVHKALGE
ncbi:MAG: phosphoenolpyruvate synthase, partial [Clostridiales bacterium]|nr:phosphoenolpyruvate synthase [Clostridiales bacterium]